MMYRKQCQLLSHVGVWGVKELLTILQLKEMETNISLHFFQLIVRFKLILRLKLG